MAGLAIAFAVVACGELPRPFQPEDKDGTNPLLALPDGAGVVVRPLSGLPDPVAIEFADRLADSLRRENVPATTGSGNAASFVVDGSTIAGARGVTSARLRLHDPAGAIIREHVVSLPAPVQGDHAPALASVAQQTASVFADALQPSAVTPAPVRRTVKVGTVTGAPGDGGVILARALGYALRRTGVQVADAADADSPVIQGAITVVPKGPRLRGVDIVWTVVAPDGAEIGEVRQGNDVPSEMIDEAWGEMAAAVAEGAAEGIVDLLDRAPRPASPRR